MRRRTMSVLMIVTALAAVVVSGAAGANQDTRLNLVAYSTPKPVMSKIISAYQSTPGIWHLSGRGTEGRPHRRSPSSTASRPTWCSSTTSRDINLLVDHGLVDRNYDKQSYKGVAATSVVVFAVRDGDRQEDQGLGRPPEAQGSRS